MLIKVLTCGVNPVDCIHRDGKLFQVPLPFIPGVDVAGYVEQVGSKVTRFKVSRGLEIKKHN